MMRFVLCILLLGGFTSLHAEEAQSIKKKTVVWEYKADDVTLYDRDKLGESFKNEEANHRLLGNMELATIMEALTARGLVLDGGNPGLMPKSTEGIVANAVLKIALAKLAADQLSPDTTKQVLSAGTGLMTASSIRNLLLTVKNPAMGPINLLAIALGYYIYQKNMEVQESDLNMNDLAFIGIWGQ